MSKKNVEKQISRHVFATIVLTVGALVGAWGLEGSGVGRDGFWVIAGAALICAAAYKFRGAPALYFFAGGVGGFWFFNLVQSGGNVWFALSPPHLQQSFLVIFAVFFLAGFGATAAGWRVGKILFLPAFAAGIAAASGVACKPPSTILEHGDIRGDRGVVLEAQREFFAAKDAHGDIFAIVPGAAGTPWSTRLAGGGRKIVCPNGLQIIGVFPKGSKFLPGERDGERLAFWTYLGGNTGGGVAPMSAVRTEILNYGKL